MYSINQDDPLSTAAAAMSLAELLEPALTAAGRGPRGHDVATALDCLAQRLECPDFFEDGTVAALRLRLEEIDADVQRHTVPAIAWVPVRYVDGVEEFEPVNVTRRTSEGDALAATGARIKTLVALIERTRTLTRDRQVARLLAALRQIDAGIEQLVEDGDDGAPAGDVVPQRAA